MKTSKTLTLIAALLATTALAGKDKALPVTPCADKGAEAHQNCSAECFKVDPNKKDQVPTKQEMRCMEGCAKKGQTVTLKCEADAVKKAEAANKKEKNHANEMDFQH